MAADIERRIATGSIVSTDFLRRLRSFWKDDFLESTELARIVRWALDYLDKYGKAPGRHIEDIYLEELRKGVLDKAEAEYLEEHVFVRLADDYDRGDQFNADYLFDEATRFFRGRAATLNNEAVQDLIERGEIDKAEELRRGFRPVTTEPAWRRADAIVPRPVSWVWRNVILRGDMTLLAGKQKTGKSQATMSLAATASTGGCWPGSDAETKPRYVVIMSAEDAVDYAIVPRLIANGADLSRCYILDAAADTAKARERIEQCLDELPHTGHGALVILDPITA
ncbi:MAG TPA: AAA family ATPase [Stellaceae bacterium]|nr:AAA family ATPase [Stellaceae bacterium]